MSESSAPAAREAGRGGSPRAAPARAAALLALLAAVLASYLAAGLEGPFLFDDRTAIVENRSLEPGASVAELLWPAADQSSAGRPLANLSFALDRRLFGLDAAAFRRTNLLLHALLACLALSVLARTFASPRCPERVRARALPLAFAASLLWALHPLLSELVLYPTQRTELLVALASVGTLACAQRAADARTSGSRRRRSAAAVGCALAGVLSKESAAAIPLAVVLWDLGFLEGGARAVLRARRGLHLALLATWVPLGAIVLAAPRARSVGFEHRTGFGDWARAQCVALVEYLEQSLWPHALVVDHGPVRATPWSEAWPGLALALALGLLTVMLLARRKPAGFALALAAVALAPSSSLVPIVTEVAAERRMTLPLLALTGLVLALAARLAPRTRTAALLGWSSLALLALGEARALGARALEYRSLETLWRTVVERAPENPRGHYNLGYELAAQGRTGEAVLRYQEALRLDPEMAVAHDNLGVALGVLGRPAEAFAHAREAVRLAPSDARSRSNLGLCLLALGKPERALERFDEALALDEGLAEAHQNRALALDALGRAPEAEAELRRALAIDPTLAVARFNLGARLARQGRASDALAQLVPLVEAQPEDLEAALLALRLQVQAGEQEAALELARRASATLRARGRARAADELLSSAAAAARELGAPELARALDSARQGL